MTKTSLPPQDCRIEISYIDPVTYASVVNHDLRKRILRSLYRAARNVSISKQQLADAVGIGYHQLIYQLNNHLKEFWTVEEEKKIRGTRMELIRAANPYAVCISVGKDNGIFMFDPLANLFGPLQRVGTRCDTCTDEDARRCMTHVKSKCDCAPSPSGPERAILISNGRKLPFRPLDHAILCALEGISRGEKCIITIPCGGCTFLKIIEIV
jgi:hypothetical protein